jgi:hypothetical protein
MTGEEFGQQLLNVVSRKVKQSGNGVITFQGLEAFLMAVFHPETENSYDRPPEPPRQHVIPQFPRLQACFDRKKPWIELDRKLVTNVDEEQACFRSNTVGFWSTIPLDAPLPKGTNAES